ncbi:hypothetical protein FKP32DRAFT_1300183 [Trametes sanguinea]|nr:hypothetical protein FKP32DRAFT_1300183 [Trametes sanguinea]
MFTVSLGYCSMLLFRRYHAYEGRGKVTRWWWLVEEEPATADLPDVRDVVDGRERTTVTPAASRPSQDYSAPAARVFQQAVRRHETSSEPQSTSVPVHRRARVRPSTEGSPNQRAAPRQAQESERPRHKACRQQPGVTNVTSRKVASVTWNVTEHERPPARTASASPLTATTTTTSSSSSSPSSSSSTKTQTKTTTTPTSRSPHHSLL